MNPSNAAVYSPPENGFRTFAVLWCSQTLAVFGMQLSFFVITVWLTTTLFPLPEQQGQLAAALSALALAFGLPNLFMAPVAGVLTDRVDRKAIMFWSNVACASLTLILLWLLARDSLTLPQLVGLQIGVSAFGCLQQSAFEASYAMLVPERQLPRANGMMQTAFSLAGILSPALAAVIIALPGLLRELSNPGPVAAAIARLTSGAVLAVGINALTFVVAALVLPFLTIPSPPARRGAMTGSRSPAAAAAKPSFWGDLKEGIGFITERRGLLSLLALFAVANLLLAPAGVLQPMLVRDNMGADFAARGMSYEAALALLGSIGAIGGVAGGVFVTAWGGLKTKRVYGVLLPMIICGLAQAAFGLSTWVWFAAVMVALRNGMSPLMNAHSQTIWQTATPREMQGRVFAVRRVIAQFTLPLGTALAGWIGARGNPGIMIAALSVILALFAAAQLANRKLMTAEQDAAMRLRPTAAGEGAVPAAPQADWAG